MELRDLLEQIGQKYDRALGQTGDAQDLLRKAPGHLAPLVPAGYLTAASGGKGNAAIVPWIAVFDPDETTTAQRGMYVVYLYAADMSTVSLSLNQGVTELTAREGTAQGRLLLQEQATAIRDAFRADQVAGLGATIDLRSRDKLPRDYEAGNVIASTYYGRFLLAKGFTANTDVHPRDLTTICNGAHWLVEAKMVRHGNGVHAAREAIGQLLMYRDFLYENPGEVRMLALFSESVGVACVEFLENHGIASVWSENGGWDGSPSATAAGLTSQQCERGQ